MTRCVVTGGAGFIGSHVVEELLGQGFNVVVLDDFSTGKRENLAQVTADIELVHGDIRDQDLLPKIFQGADFCVSSGCPGLGAPIHRTTGTEYPSQ